MEKKGFAEAEACWPHYASQHCTLMPEAEGWIGLHVIHTGSFAEIWRVAAAEAAAAKEGTE